jgi:hypothetical protein
MLSDINTFFTGLRICNHKVLWLICVWFSIQAILLNHMSTLNWEISLRRIGERILLKSIACSWRKKNHCSVISMTRLKLSNESSADSFFWGSDQMNWKRQKTISSWFLLGWKDLHYSQGDLLRIDAYSVLRVCLFLVLNVAYVDSVWCTVFISHMQNTSKHIQFCRLWSPSPLPYINN